MSEHIPYMDHMRTIGILKLLSPIFQQKTLNTDLQPSPTEFAIQQKSIFAVPAKSTGPQWWHWNEQIEVRKLGWWTRNIKTKSGVKPTLPPKKAQLFGKEAIPFENWGSCDVTITTIKHVVSAKWFKLAVDCLMVEPNNWHFLPQKNTSLIVRDPHKSQADHQPLMEFLPWWHIQSPFKHNGS